MIFEFIEDGPLIWPTIEENGVTRPRKYSELTLAEALQADCDVKATNIILQGLPNEIYALVSHHKIAKDLWERNQLFMQGTSLTKQKKECKLYDEFDKFAYKKGETLRDFYLRFSLLLNDLNIYNVLHTTNIDQLHAYLEQHEFHANEVCLMHKRNSDPLALVATHHMTQSSYQTHQKSYQNSQFHPQVSQYQSQQYGSPYQSQHYSTNQPSTPLSLTYPSNDYQSSVHHNVYSLQPSIPQLEYVPMVNQQQSKFSPLVLGLTVPVFKHGDDPIDAINHMMSFLTSVVTSCYPTTNNQFRNLSNPRQQATINDGRVTLQIVEGRQTTFAPGTNMTYTTGRSGSNYGKQRTVICYNCKGEGHMSKQCTKSKRKRDDSWFKEKVLLVQAQVNGQILHEEELAYLADPGIPEVALMENMSQYGSHVFAESSVENHLETKITSDSNIIPYSQYVKETQHAAVQNSSSSAQQDALILSVIEQLKTQVINHTKINLDNKTVNDTLTAELEKYKEQLKVLKEGQNVEVKSRDNFSDSHEQDGEIDRLKQTLSEQLQEK
nr:hypothetical protein [Tanacetum cinerariifolium]